MIKKLIRKIIHSVYEIGRIEEERQNAEKMRNDFNRNANIGSNVVFEGCVISNHQDDKTKISIGNNSVIKGELMLFKHGGEIIIGENCFVGANSKIWSARKIKLGNRVLVSHNVNIHDNISHPINPKLRHEDIVHIFTKGFQKSNDLKEADVIIEDDAWIGFNAIILKGVRIGKGAIVGAGAIVTKDVPEFSIVVGNSAVVIRKSDD